MFAHSSQISGIVETPRAKPIEHRRIVGGLRERIIYMPGSQMLQSPVPESQGFFLPIIEPQEQKQMRNSSAQSVVNKICNKIENMIYEQDTKLGTTIECIQDQISRIQKIQEEIEIRLISLQHELRLKSPKQPQNQYKGSQVIARPRSLVR